MTWEVVRQAGAVVDGERFILQHTARRKGQEQSVGVVVSDQALYEVADDSAGAPPEVRRWDFREIHSVHKLEKNLVRVFLISVSAHGKVSKEKVKGWGAGETASNFLIPRDFICATTDEKDELFSVMRTNLVDTWQAHLECEIESIPPTEYYQNHLFLTKRNRKGKLQIRFVVLTDKKMYNFEARMVGRRIEPQKCKWAFPISDLQRVTTYADDPQAFSITVDTKSAERKQVKSSVTYLVDNKHERTLFIREVKRLYFQAEGTELEQEETTSKPPKKDRK